MLPNRFPKQCPEHLDYLGLEMVFKMRDGVKRKKDSWTWTTVWGLWGGGGGGQV